jgi:hypothetical protein
VGDAEEGIVLNPRLALRIDEAVAGSVDVKLQPLMISEDIKAGSIRVLLSSLLKKIDDEGLRLGEIKKAIGPALVWLNMLRLDTSTKIKNQQRAVPSNCARLSAI